MMKNYIEGDRALLKRIFIDKGDKHLRSARSKRHDDPLDAIREMFIAEDCYVRFMLESDNSLKNIAYDRYMGIQKESLDLIYNTLKESMKGSSGYCEHENPCVGNDPKPEKDKGWIDECIVDCGYSFDDIVGYEYIKEKFRVHMVYPRTMEMPFRIKGNNTILMYGPPGCGKSFFVAALSNEIPGTRVYSIDASNLLSKYYGQSSRNISDIFRAASNNDDVIFIDEIDSISMKRGNEDPASNRTISTLLNRIDGVSKDNINLIAATNRPDLIDDALLSRFNSIIYVSPPDHDAKKSIFELELSKHIESDIYDIDTRSVIDHMCLKEKYTSKIYSGRDISRIVINSLEMYSIAYARKKRLDLDDTLFSQIIDETEPSIDKDMLSMYNSMSY